MENFKIHVTPEESEIVQKLLFLVGGNWRGSINIDHVQHTEKPYLFFRENYLTHTDNDPDYFRQQNLRELTLEYLVNEVEFILKHQE